MNTSKFPSPSLLHLLVILFCLGSLVPSPSLARVDLPNLQSTAKLKDWRADPVAVLASKIMLRISVATDGTQGNGDSSPLCCSGAPSISADGRFVVFLSDANNLVPADTNGLPDVFVHDRLTGTTEIDSVASNGMHGNSLSDNPSISADARYLAFDTSAGNLVLGDTNGLVDVFVHDRQTGETTRVSVTSAGGQSCGEDPSISANGRYIAFQSLCTNLFPHVKNYWNDVYVRDRQSGTTEIVSINSDGIPGDGESGSPIISADGRYVAFESTSTNLVAGDTNGVKDLFVHDRQTGITERINIASDGTQSNLTCGASTCSLSMSADARFVAFRSNASNLVPGDTNHWPDVFVRDRLLGKTMRVSVDSNGTQGNDVSSDPFISADGRFVAFESTASNLAPGDSGYYYDVFLHDRQTGITTRISTSDVGVEGNGYSRHPVISADTNWIAFSSGASNLVAGDTNQSIDIFETQRGAQQQNQTFLPMVIR